MGRMRRGGFAQKRMRAEKQRRGMMALRKTNAELRAQANQQSSGPTTGTTAGGETGSSPMNTSNRR
jgi:hypothetical protein